jgi:hypothetical protein
MVADSNICLRFCVLYYRAATGLPCGPEAVCCCEEAKTLRFLLWCILLVLCWPLALVALVLYPFVWLLLLPFRVVGIAVEGALGLVWAIVTLPARLLRAI